MKRNILLVLLFLISLKIFPQQVTNNLSDLGIFSNLLPGGEVKITQDQRLQTIIANHITANKERPLKGWRVQIYFGTGGSSKAEAEKIKKSFLLEYPDIGAYLIYDSPHFKVRVGNFRTKIEAERFKSEIIDKYEKTFLVEDEIDFPDL